MTLFSYIKIHKINHEYEFMDKQNRILTGIIKRVKIDIESDFWESKVYEVMVEDTRYFVDHETNRVI